MNDRAFLKPLFLQPLFLQPPALNTPLYISPRRCAVGGFRVWGIGFRVSGLEQVDGSQEVVFGRWLMELGVADGYWNVFFGLSTRQGFSLAESNAILRNEGYFIGKMAR
jgi:hypothetical protein